MRTFLMTATLTQAGLATLKALFRAEGQSFEVVSSLYLRPEPAYHIVRCDSEDQKLSRLHEAIDHLPRPAIVYTLRRDDANALGKELARRGYSRLDVMTGDTNDAKRKKIVERWKDGVTDLVIGTSAFGLGIDKADVRAVIHACVPESLDRYYQEVGRGGRDGKASLSLLLFTERDLQTARRMSSGKITIGIDRGAERWNRMFYSERSRCLGDDLYQIPIDLQPTFRPDDIDMKNIRNEDWNSNTLTLMARAGMIELDDDPSVDWSSKSRLVRILKADHNKEDAWLRYVSPVRSDSVRSNAQQMQLLEELLDARRCAASIFAEAYSLSEGIEIAPNCGGCAVHGWRPKGWLEPESPSDPRPCTDTPRNIVAGWPTSSPVACVFYEGDGRSHAFLSSLRQKMLRCSRAGIRALILDDELREWLLDEEDDLAYRARSWGIFVDAKWHRRESPNVATLAVVRSENVPGGLADAIERGIAEAPLLALLPADARFPDGRSIQANFSGPSHRFDGWL